MLFNKKVYSDTGIELKISPIKEDEDYIFELVDDNIFVSGNGEMTLMKIVFDFIKKIPECAFKIEYLVKYENCVDTFYNRYEYGERILDIYQINLNADINEEECPNCGKFINTEKIELDKPYICSNCDERIEYDGTVYHCLLETDKWEIEGDFDDLGYNPNIEE